MDALPTTQNKSGLSPVQQDGRTYLVSQSDLRFFLQNVGRRVQFQIEFSDEFEAQHFVFGPYIGTTHSFDAVRDALNFKFDGGDADHYEHILCVVSDIRRILFSDDPASNAWREGDHVLI